MKHLEFALGYGNQFWKYIIVLVVSFVAASFIGAIPLIAVSTIAIKSSGGDMTDLAAGLSDMAYLNSIGLSSNTIFALMVFPLVLGFFALLLLVKVFHNQSWKQIINGTNKVRWGRVGRGAACWTVLMVLYYAIDYIMAPSNYVLQFDLSMFIPLVLLSLLLLPFQISFEEFAMRGYLAQGLGALSKSRWVALLVPSIVFGLLHTSNPEVKEFGFAIMMPQYILMGVLFGLTAILDDGIEIAIGMHAANNIFLSLFFTHSASALQTPAVFRFEEVDPYKELISLIIMGALAIAYFYKKYNWSFSTLNKKVEAEVEVVE